MPPLVTVVIPVAPYHTDVAQVAYKSAKLQTIECQVVEVFDDGQRGAGWARNKIAMDRDTAFICFLDADDQLDPTFIEDCLRVYEQGKYVYTGWYQDDQIMIPRFPDPYLAHDFEDGKGTIGGYHLVTTLFPTAVFRALGGFDEALTGMEDTDFYMRCQQRGFCGVLCPKPLLHYNGTGGNCRSKAFRELPDYHDRRRSIIERNGGNEAMACNCVTGGASNGANLQGAQPGDVTVEALQPGAQIGSASGRYYQRPTFVGQRMMVDPRDVDAMQGVYRKVETFSDLAPTRGLVEAGLV